MRRLQKGFTLAEVLITLGLIGVVASITLPSLSVNIVKQQTGPALSKAINTLETANALALEEGQARTLDELTTTSKAHYFDEALSSHIQWRKETLAKSYYQYNNTTAYSTRASNMYTTKDGITFLRKSDDAPTVCENRNNLGLGYSGSYYTVYVDVNGNRKGPNSLGRDLFLLWVDTKGTVIPYGGAAYVAYVGSTASSTWQSTCYSAKQMSEGLTCAGSIADNGFKVIY